MVWTDVVPNGPSKLCSCFITSPLPLGHWYQHSANRLCLMCCNVLIWWFSPFSTCIIRTNCSEDVFVFSVSLLTYKVKSYFYFYKSVFVCPLPVSAFSSTGGSSKPVQEDSWWVKDQLPAPPTCRPPLLPEVQVCGGCCSSGDTFSFIFMLISSPAEHCMLCLQTSSWFCVLDFQYIVLQSRVHF